MAKRAAQFPDAGDLARLRARGAAIKERALARLPELLEQLEARCTENGIKVHWAETTGDANRIVLDIFQSHGVKTVVKGKSMVSEEMHLNAFLGEHGIEAVESGIGEYIIQLAGGSPAISSCPVFTRTRLRSASFSPTISKASAIPKTSMN